MLKFGVLGLGQMGGNFADVAAQHGLPTVVCNSSELDLSRLKNVIQENRYHLKHKRDGAGANRIVGRDVVINHIDDLESFVTERLSGCDMILVVSSSSGGCGSGAHWIGIELASQFCDAVSSITTLPTEAEVRKNPQAAINTSDFFKELSNVESLASAVVIDNDKARKSMTELTERVVFEYINQDLIRNLIAINQLTKEQSYTSNLDDADLLDILNQTGGLVIAKATLKVEDVTDVNSITDAVHRSWEQYHMDLTEGQIVKAAVLARIPEKLADKIDAEGIFSAVGQPLSVREVCFEPNKPEAVEIYTILAGLNYPVDRLQELDQQIESRKGALINQLETSQRQQIKGETWADKFRTKQEQPQKTSLRDRLAQFNK